MELHKAILTAARFVAKGKDSPEILRLIRFISDGSWVHATDGVSGIVIKSDIPIPDLVLNKDVYSALSKHPITKVGIAEGADGDKIATTFKLTSTGKYAFERQDPNCFPVVPPMPETLSGVEWFGQITKVFHAASRPGMLHTGKERPDLQCVNFRKDRVEATDAARMSIVDIPAGITGMVHANVFKYWPKGPVLTGSTPDYAWFQIGDQYRYGRFQEGAFASNKDLREWLPEVHEGPWMSVEVRALQSAVKEAVKAAPTRAVLLKFGLMGLHLSAGSDDSHYDGHVPGRLGMVQAPSNQVTTPSIIIDGKLLEESLKTVDTPCVRMCHPEPSGKKLRFESGAVASLLFYRVE